jgi:hypothetical protein
MVRSSFSGTGPGGLTGWTIRAFRLRPRWNGRGKLPQKRGNRIIRSRDPPFAGRCRGLHVLELRVLGKLEVVRDGGALMSPPSRETPDAFAYRALTPAWPVTTRFGKRR